jgi:hypothetical protein
MKIEVKKGNEIRWIKPSKKQEYLDAGWQQPGSNEGEEVIRLKPPAKSSRNAVKIIQEEANDNIQGE